MTQDARRPDRHCGVHASDFLLDPDVVFLNHGSFGACPRWVHDEYQRIQRRLESEPVRFLQRELPDLLVEARTAMAEFIGAEADEVVLVANPTYAVNEIVRSLNLGPGDEVVTSNHEYGACRNAWQFMSEKNGFSVVEVALPLTIESDETFTDLIWAAVTPNTRAIFLSHITSPTALTFPISGVCKLARASDIITVIDGAHAPGQIELDLNELGADYYVGTCHKWMCAPKGASFFYSRRDMQHLIEPLIVGWGWGDARQFDSGKDFLDFHEWLGTDDPSALLSVPAAIEFQKANDWLEIRRRCHDLAVEAIDAAQALPHIEPVHNEERFSQMALLELTANDHDPAMSSKDIQARLFDEFRVEVPVITWVDPSAGVRTFVRVSVQAYNTQADIDALTSALSSIIAPEAKS